MLPTKNKQRCHIFITDNCPFYNNKEGSIDHILKIIFENYENNFSNPLNYAFGIRG